MAGGRQKSSRTSRVMRITFTSGWRIARFASAVIAAVCLAIGLDARAAFGQTGSRLSKLRPIDEGARDPTFARFRKDLLDAAQRRDLDAVLRAMAIDVQVTQMGEKGIEALKRQWDDGLPDQFLHELVVVLRLGGRFSTDRTEFTGPYTYTDFPGTSDVEMTEYVVATGRSTRVFAKPDRRARVVATLQHDILPYYATTELGWREVVLPDGGRGFVRTDEARCPCDMMIHAAKRNGQWRIVALHGGYEE
jgi:hypothetical protein